MARSIGTIAVFSGSNVGRGEAYIQAAGALGGELARRGIKIVSAMTDLSQDDLAELGIALLFGADTAALTRCRALVLAAAKRSGHKLPVEHFQQLA